MGHRKLILFGSIAVERGFLSADRYGGAVFGLGQMEELPDPETFWGQPGLLTAAQVVEVREMLASAPTVGRRQAAFGPTPKGTTFVLRSTASSEAPPEQAPEPFPAFGFERYERHELLGVGGMGEVVECFDHALQRRVAIKTLPPERQEDLGAVWMLKREARLTGSLEHPGIVPIYDVGVLPELGAFYAMRLVEQATLSTVLDGLRRGDPDVVAKYSQKRLLHIFIQVCQAAHYAHSRGVVHCDLKPANILLGSYGEVMIGDWGLAYSKTERQLLRGGTPGYMAPENEHPSAADVDARMDVFALGAILYDLLTLCSAFPSRPYEPPVPPRRRAPDRDISEELESICLKALAFDPTERYATAEELSAAIEAFFEGTRERERRQERADELVRVAGNMAEGYHELTQSRAERMEEIRALRAEVAPWDPPEQKRLLWDAEDRLRVLEHLRLRSLQAAISAYEQALDEVPGHAPARAGLRDMYAAELRRAEDRRDDFDRVYFEQLVRQYEEAPGEASRREGLLIVSGDVERVTLALVEESDRRFVPGTPQPLPTLPCQLALAPGRYLVVHPADHGEIRYPVLLRSGREHRLALDATPPAVSAEEVYVPGGPALLGGGDDDELRSVDVPPFVIARRPVTFGEYLELVAERIRAGADDAASLVPAKHDGAPYFVWNGEGFVAGAIRSVTGDDVDLLALPAFGVSSSAAAAYASWRGARDGLPLRLPYENEWEKASRGCDGRRYPWGDRFDPSFCKMRESRPDAPRPEPSGRFPFDESPYGVRDLAGGIADWVLPSEAWPGAYRYAVSRGGAWSDWPHDCRLTARRSYRAGETSDRVGFRLARSIDPA